MKNPYEDCDDLTDYFLMTFTLIWTGAFIWYPVGSILRDALGL